MRFYNQAHEFYRGMDLHFTKMYLCVVNHQGEVKLHKNIRNRADHFLRQTTRFRNHDLVVGVRST